MSTSDLQLSRVDFFSDFPESILEHLERSATLRTFKKGTIIINEGDDSHSIFLLLKGKATAFTEDKEGNEFIVNTFTENDCFGELAALDGSPRTANVISKTECECLVFPKFELDQCIDSNPATARAIINRLVRKIRDMTEDISCLALLDVYGRISRVISSSLEQGVDGSLMTSKITHQEIANQVGSSREMVSKILKDLRIGGYIKISDQRIELLKPLPERW